MKALRSIIAIIPLIFLLQACAPAYVPNVVSSPALREKGDLTLSAHYGNAGVDMQGAYGLSDHWGILINGSYNQRTTDSVDLHKHGFVEAGLGYFATEGEHMYWSMFGGFGGGNYQSYFQNDLTTIYNFVNVNRFFVQPSAGFYSRYFEGDLAFRLAFLGINGYRDNYDNSPEKFKGFYPMLEPAVSLKFGPKHFKFFFQGGLSINLQKDHYLNYEPLILSLGIQFKFNTGGK